MKTMINNTLTSAIGLLAIFSATVSQATVINSDLTVYNTLIDAQTGGAEFFTASSSMGVTDPGLEFNDYLGLFDVDFTSASASMVLIGNTPVLPAPTLFPSNPPRFDTYYYFFDDHNVTSVTLDSLSGDLADFATVDLVTAGDLNFVNASFTTNTDGFFIRFGPGTDYTTFSPANSDATVEFSFTAVAVPEPSSALLLAIFSLSLFARRRYSSIALGATRGWAVKSM